MFCSASVSSPFRYAVRPPVVATVLSYANTSAVFVVCHCAAELLLRLRSSPSSPAPSTVVFTCIQVVVYAAAVTSTRPATPSVYAPCRLLTVSYVCCPVCDKPSATLMLHLQLLVLTRSLLVLLVFASRCLQLALRPLSSPSATPTALLLSVPTVQCV